MTTRLTNSERGANKPKGQGLCFQMTSEITIINMVTIILKKVMIMLNNALHVCLKCFHPCLIVLNLFIQRKIPSYYLSHLPLSYIGKSHK
jgi:biotin synthase-related radical SAM superfamily protein